MKKALIALVIVAAIAAIAFWKSRPEPLFVRVGQAEEGAVEKTVSNTRAGTIKACRRSKLSMPMGGVVSRLLVKKGDQVKQGQLLLELWSHDQEAAVSQAYAALDTARHSKEQACLLADRSKREAERATTLLAKGLIAPDTADNLQSQSEAQESACESARSQVKSAEAALALQKAVRERLRLHAPFAGIIAEINGEIGEYVTPSPPGVATPPAVDIIDTTCLYATAPIDEVDAAGLRLGMPVRITLDAFRNRAFTGKLTRIAPYVQDLEKQARTVDVDVRFDQVPDDVTLLIGYSADITIVLEGREKTLRIPTEAITGDNEIWVLEPTSGQKPGQLKKRKITTGIGNYRFTEVVGGIKSGERILLSPDQEGIAEGLPAQPQTEQDNQE